MHLTSEEFVQNPYPIHRQLREIAGGHWLALDENRMGSTGMWLFSRYADVSELLRESTQVSKESARLVPQARRGPLDDAMLNADPPRHRRLRDLAVPAFSTERLLAIEKTVALQVDALLDRALEAGRCDFLRDIASPVPLGVVCAVLGVPERDGVALKNWTDQLLAGFDSATATPQVLSKREDCMRELLRYFEAQLRRADHAQGTILGLLANQPPTDSSSGEALGLCLLMMVAGYETTIDLLGNGLFTLLQHPDQLQLLRREPALLDSAIDEMLRFETPLQRTTFRVIRETIQIGGRQLEPGTQVAALLGAANRDERQFSNADCFDIRRSPNRHLAFGLGVHRCLGEKLARLEAQLVFTRLFERTRSIELTTTAPRFRHTTMFRSLDALPILLAPR